MRICIYAASCDPIEGDSVKIENLKVAERAVMNFARALSDQHEVYLVTSHPSPTSGKIKFMTPKALETFTSVDAFIVIKDWIPIFTKLQTKNRYLWIPRGADEFSNMGVGDPRIAKGMDALLVSEELDKDGIAHISGFPKEKIRVLGDPELMSGVSWVDVANNFLNTHHQLVQEKTA